MKEKFVALVFVLTGCSVTEIPKTNWDPNAPRSIKDGDCPLSVRIHTADELEYAWDDTYELSISVRDKSWLKGSITCYAIIDGIERLMYRDGNKYRLHFNHRFGSDLEVQYKIVYSSFTLAPSSSDITYLVPLDRARRVKIKSPPQEVFITAHTVEIECDDDEHASCPSQVIGLKNYSPVPVQIVAAEIKALQPNNHSVFCDWSGAKFCCVFNGYKPPFTLNSMEETTFVVHCQKTKNPCSGQLVINTDHAQYPSINLPLFAEYKK